MTKSNTTTAKERAAQRASVLAAIGKKDTVISIMASPASLSRAKRYLNRSVEKEKKMTAKDIDEENSDCPSIKNPNHLDSNLGVVHANVEQKY